MRIKDKARLIIGVIDLLGGITCLIACVYLHRDAKIALTFVPIICGVISLIQSIETKKQRQKRKEELKKFFEGVRVLEQNENSKFDIPLKCKADVLKCYHEIALNGIAKTENKSVADYFEKVGYNVFTCKETYIHSKSCNVYYEIKSGDYNERCNA